MTRKSTSYCAAGCAPKRATGRVVLISGEPGIGKSRIIAALAERLGAEPYQCLHYFCSPYHRDSALLPFIDQLGRIRPRRSTFNTLEKIEAVLARAMPPADDVAFNIDLLSLPASERYPLPNLTP